MIQLQSPHTQPSGYFSFVLRPHMFLQNRAEGDRIASASFGSQPLTAQHITVGLSYLL